MYKKELPPEIIKMRKTGHPIHPLLEGRWSPRSMTGQPIKDEELMSLFEAARWAPSSYNGQPWRFLYAKRDTPDWDLFYNLMVPFNQEWTKNAAVLLVVVSKNTFDHNGKPSRTHSYDTGSAWMSLAIEGTARGYVVHGMEGFDYAKAKKALHIPDDHTVEAMAAIGIRAPKEKLSPELQKKEEPSDRRPLSEIIIQGKFK